MVAAALASTSLLSVVSLLLILSVGWIVKAGEVEEIVALDL